MKTLKLTLAAVVLSAFTMTAQQDAKAATKTEVSKEVKEEVRAPHKMAEQNKASVKSAAVQDSDAAAQAAPRKATKPVSKKAKVKSKKAVLTQDEKAAQAAGKKKGN